MDARDVAHGAVSEVFYHSKTLGTLRRMHVYTPPGYASGNAAYPVLYLLHGASDSDDSWTSVGRANFILDNLLAEKKIRPMIVVMPAGHVEPWRWGQPLDLADQNLFGEDLLNDIMPYMNAHYRLMKGREHRAIAGLSMGGFQALSLAREFPYVGVFSAHLPGGQQDQDLLNDPQLKAGLKLLWFATGKEDFLLEGSRASVDLFRRHGFDVTYRETDGGHRWINWQLYLREFALLLFE
jgi:enterochelin esterase family protein